MEQAGRSGGEVVVDARGHRCPTPTLRLRRVLERVEADVVVILLADDPMARIDVPHFAGQAGHEVLEVAQDAAAGWRFRVRKGASAAGAGRG